MLVFVHINKTAGSTMRYILRSSYGSRHCDVEPWSARWDETPFGAEDLRRLRRLYPNLASIAGHRLTGYADLGEPEGMFDYFTFLRDPLKMCASRFQYHVDHRKKDVEFDEWIQREWLRDAQTKRIAGTADAADAIEVIRRKGIFVGLTEHFDESLVLLQALRAADLDIRYERVNVARRNTLADDLLASPRTRQALVDANRADLELYRYAKEELFPAARRAYGPGLDAAAAGLQQASRRAWNRRRLAACRAKSYLVYKPALRFYRWKQTGHVAVSQRGVDAQRGQGER
jgi:hypothetical protein